MTASVNNQHLIRYEVSPSVADDDLNQLFEAAWDNYQPILSRSLLYVCAYLGERLVGFVNLAWDGGVHAFLLDTTVHPDVGRCGIGTGLVRHAIDSARGRGVEWIHVDYEPHLHGFYAACGFQPTEAGLVQL